ncbi:MAG: hypothetical protein R2715_17190 [Ilumatobacteraceae bacterium]
MVIDGQISLEAGVVSGVIVAPSSARAHTRVAARAARRRCLAHLQQEFDGTVWNDVVRITGTGELLAELRGAHRLDRPVSVAVSAP